MSVINNYIAQNKERFLNELLELLKIPSVSADPAYKAEVKRCAEHVKQSLIDAGVDKAEICETAGHPIVFGEKRSIFCKKLVSSFRISAYEQNINRFVFKFRM